MNKLPTLIALLLAICPSLQAKVIRFSGYEWTVRESGYGGPGPNQWDENNAWVDGEGRLHLKLTQRDGKWYCAEVYTNTNFGFGSYQFQLIGRVDQLDQNLVFGLFTYPEHDIGPDGTHEIDIEFSRWGHAGAPIGSYTIWPPKRGVHQATKSFSMNLDGDKSTHRFTWSPTGLLFQSLQGFSDGGTGQFESWNYAPEDPEKHISRKPMPLHINLWCYKDAAPSNGQPVEVIVSAFQFKPQP